MLLVVKNIERCLVISFLLTLLFQYEGVDLGHIVLVNVISFERSRVKHVGVRGTGCFAGSCINTIIISGADKD